MRAALSFCGLPPPGPQTQSDCQGPAATLTEPPGAWEQQTAVAHGQPGPGGRDRGAAGAGRPPGHTRPTPHSVLAWREQEPPGTPAFSHRGSDATCQGPPHRDARSACKRAVPNATRSRDVSHTQHPCRGLFATAEAVHLGEAWGPAAGRRSSRRRGDQTWCGKSWAARAARGERGAREGGAGRVVTVALRDASAIFL